MTYNLIMELKNLEVYKYAIELSNISWKIYASFDWKINKTIGDQFI